MSDLTGNHLESAVTSERFRNLSMQGEKLAYCFRRAHAKIFKMLLRHTVDQIHIQCHLSADNSDVARFAVELFPNGLLEWVKNAGHFTTINFPDKLTTSNDRFFSATKLVKATA